MTLPTGLGEYTDEELIAELKERGMFDSYLSDVMSEEEPTQPIKEK